MEQSLSLMLNGRARTLEGLSSPCALDAVLTALAMRADRIAVELNGELAPRTGWADQTVQSGDKLEIVHFVGGGLPPESDANPVPCR
ncbi:MAG: sulfur carrier protein ThiS [Janthinobacterium lividum]